MSAVDPVYRGPRGPRSAIIINELPITLFTNKYAYYISKICIFFFFFGQDS